MIGGRRQEELAELAVSLIGTGRPAGGEEELKAGQGGDPRLFEMHGGVGRATDLADPSSAHTPADVCPGVPPSVPWDRDPELPHRLHDEQAKWDTAVADDL